MSRVFQSDRVVGDEHKWLEFLSGRLTDQPRPMAITPSGQGGKFTPEGAVLPFPGNTFLCHIAPQSKAFAAISRIAERIQALPTARFFTFLPPSSYHMTVFCGVSGSPLGHDGWPQDVEATTSLETLTANFQERLRDRVFPSGFVVGANHLKAGASFHVEPRNRESHNGLWASRDHLRDVTGLYRPDHDTYKFHITIAYQMAYMSTGEAEQHLRACDAAFDTERTDLDVIELGPIEFCLFENMHAFQVLRTL